MMSKIFCKLLRIAWDEEKKYYFYLMMNFICVGIYSYCIIKLPSIVIEMLENKMINYHYLLGLFLIVFISGTLSSLWKYLYTPIGFKLRYKLLYKLMEKDLSIPLDKLENPDILSDIWDIYQPVSSIDGVQWIFLNIGELSGNLSILLISIGILVKLNVYISIALIFWLFLFIYIMLAKSEKKDKINQDANKYYRELEYLKDVSLDVSYGKELRVYNLRNWLINKFNGSISNAKKFISKYHYQSTSLDIIDTVYQFIRDIVIYLTLAYMFYHNQISLAAFSTYIILIIQLNEALHAITDNINRIVAKYSNINKMFDYIQIDNENNKGKTIQQLGQWVIKFENVSFHYPGNEKWIFKNLNFTLHKGDKIGIIGLNGAGKTTLLKLLMRLYHPTIGKITLNGLNIEEFKLIDYYSLFSPVFQDINIFPYSIIDNLLFTNKEYDDNEIRRILETVGLYEKLGKYSLNHNLTKLFDKDGILFSGGELQKFAMARALCAERNILILDEPTSALDALAENKFYENVNENCKDKTILFISHRLSSTQFCDKIILIDNQNILESGTHEELMSKKGNYFKLFQVQSKYYKEENLYEK